MTTRQHLLALIGLPGSGKTTVGRMLARRLQLPFLDSDQEIERRMGCSIRQFFEEQGEARFRDIEAEVIDALTRSGPGVLSTGGGAVLRPENRARLHERCRVIYLHARPEDLARRLRRDTQRPLLQVDDPLKRLRELHAARDPLYRETAHDVLETGRPSVAMLVNMILMQLELAPQPAAGGTGPALGR
ncbi:shikimate kinase [Tibeticola sp.]|uniref:shikimate kinase n=1 Tax=Tibeticola sp. TaxID=2005368 RepID=UPI00258DB4BE|nr:shikimate kinase [Tibeticola sp.]